MDRLAYQQSVARWFPWLVALGCLLNISALNSWIIEPDGALYASVAKTMAQRNDYVQLFAEGKDWLDKPHFPFWMAALSYEIFGFTPFAYKFPALLFYFLGAWYTYRWALLFYSKTIAQVSVLIYLTALHLVLSNNDVRAEPYLTGLLIASTYHFYRASQKAWTIHLFWACLFTACAVMTKGIFILIPIGGGLMMHWVIRKEWAQFRSLQWYVALLMILIFITPELYTLWVQFDQHPEKVVFGRTGVSGLRFFFWDSQFGRFMNTGPIKGKGDPSFFLHTLLWAFLPWCFLLYTALFQSIRKLFRKESMPEFISLFTALICFLLFSASKFQLPHYLNIVFPFFAVITAAYIDGWVTDSKVVVRWQWIQRGLCFILLLLGFLLSLALDDPYEKYALIWLSVGAIAITSAGRETPRAWALFFSSFSTMIVVFGFMNLFFYPWLMGYQSGSHAARIINRTNPNLPVLMWKADSYSLQFGAQTEAIYLRGDSSLNAYKGQACWLYTSREQADSLTRAGWQIDRLHTLPHIKVTQLSAKFLRPETRGTKVQERVLGFLRGD
jgi:4-amino-4-deoxy-L-arabinose transferase-like glycosyltransferase